MRILGRLLCLLAALAVIEGPYLAVQGYAWLTMIQDRTPELGFEAAVADTLSGDHPCEKCLALEDERERKSEKAPISETRLLSQLAPSHFGGRPLALFPPSRTQQWCPRAESWRDLWQADVPCLPPWLG